MDVDRAGPIAIIAGNGSFPLELAESLTARGKSCDRGYARSSAHLEVAAGSERVGRRPCGRS